MTAPKLHVIFYLYFSALYVSCNANKYKNDNKKLTYLMFVGFWYESGKQKIEQIYHSLYKLIGTYYMVLVVSA